MDENPRISDLRKKIEKDPGSRLFAQLAEELRKDGRLEEAIQVAYDGLARHPAYPSARLTLARALLDSGRAEEARPELEQIVKAAPDNILAGRLLGEALDALGETDAAIRQFERALMFSPGDKVMTAHLSALKSRVAASAPPAAPAPPPAVSTAPPAYEPPALAFEAPADTLPSHFAAEPEAAPVAFAAEESAAALPAFGDDAGTAETIAFGQAPDAETIGFAPTPAAETLAFAQAPEADALAAAAPAEPEGETAATVELTPEAETIPFALSGAPVEFSDSSASLPAFQFDDPAPAVPEPAPEAPAVPEPEPEPEPTPAPVAPPPAPAPAPAFSLALDRDLASGTISPGAFNMAELQRHFEAIAAAERAAAAGQPAPAPAPAPPPPPPLPAPAPVVVASVPPPAPPVPSAPPPVPVVPPTAYVPPRVPASGDTQPPSSAPVEIPDDDSLTFSTDEFETQSIDTADTMSILAPEGGFGQPPAPETEAEFDPFDESIAVAEELPPPAPPQKAAPEPDPDLASQTLPLTSLTLADLYLQQGLKAEAAAVLSQVVREEPANEQARSKLAVVSAAAAETMTEPAEHFADAGASVEAPLPVAPSRPRTPAEVRAATITALKAFQGAIEREALEQKATEIRTR